MCINVEDISFFAIASEYSGYKTLIKLRNGVLLHAQETYQTVAGKLEDANAMIGLGLVYCN